MAPEIPTAIYKLVATGFPVCPTCSACGLQPKSETGLEQAVAAPKTAAKSSIKFQFLDLLIRVRQILQYQHRQ